MALLRFAGAALLTALISATTASAFWIGPPPPAYANVREYVNDVTGHFVLLSDPLEISGVENGAAGAGWRSTGWAFTAYALSEMQGDAATAVPVCRFYAPAPVNSHFYTADPAECDFLKTHDTGWKFEKVDFKVNVPVQGSCGTLTPIWRAYNDRAAQLDSNHRYGSDASVRSKMLAEGWKDEGIAFCAEGAGRNAAKSFWIMGTTGPSASCGIDPSSSTPCIALHNLPPMNATLMKYLPPRYYPVNPDYSTQFAGITGWSPLNSQDVVYAPLITADHASDARHSFVEDAGGSGPIGMHVNGADRLAGDYASIEPQVPVRIQPLTLAASQAPVFPFAPRVDEPALRISFQLEVTTVRRADAASHVYGHPLLDFVDHRSGHHLWITLQAFGTNAPADFVGKDVNTGATIVSTAFRADPLFGTRLTGDYLACSADAAGGSCPGRIDFGFMIEAAGFAKVIELARGADTSLSPAPGDYELVSFRFHAEAYRDAEAGLVIDWPSLYVY